MTHARHVEGRYHRRCWATCSAELRSRSHFKSTWSTVAGFMRAVTLRDSLLRCPIWTVGHAHGRKTRRR